MTCALDQPPLNICHLGKYYPPAPGGIETHVQTLARAQAALGANVRVVCVNHCQASLPETPFGGFKDSGLGKEGGIEGLQEFMQIKYVSQI